MLSQETRDNLLRLEKAANRIIDEALEGTRLSATDKEDLCIASKIIKNICKAKYALHEHRTQQMHGV